MFNCLLTLDLLVEAAGVPTAPSLVDVFILRTSLQLHTAFQTVGTSGNPYFLFARYTCFYAKTVLGKLICDVSFAVQVFLSLLAAIYLGRCFIHLHLSQILQILCEKCVSGLMTLFT